MAATDRRGGGSAPSAPANGSSARRGPSAPRAVAARVLGRVWKQAAYASRALDAELRRAAGIDPRDAALATELVYGVLRTAPALEQLVARHARGPGWRKHPMVRAHVLMGAYSIAFLERVPAHAAVSEAVLGVRATADARVARFANAVLRRLAVDAERGALPTLAAATEQSVPSWLAAALRQTLGTDEARALWVSEASGPWLGLCLGPNQDRAAWIERLTRSAPGAEVRAGSASPRAVLVRGAGDLRRLPGAGDAWHVQEEGSQVVALCAGADLGARVLDACAGRGTKCRLLAAAVGPAGVVDAADVDPGKMRHLVESSERWGAPRNAWLVDWTRGVGDVPDGYDLVLVDAPCTGLGTLRRRPELMYRLTLDDLERLAATQAEIVRSAASRVRPGGRLVYAVCSVSAQETSGVVSRLVDSSGSTRLRPARFLAPLADQLAGGGTSIRLSPAVHGTDGYFVASFTVEAR